MKKKFHTAATRYHDLNGRRKESKQNFYRPVEREFSDLLRLTAGKPMEVFLSKQGRKGKSRGRWNYVTAWTLSEGGDEGWEDIGPDGTNPESSE
jgi:hypothetical protein